MTKGEFHIYANSGPDLEFCKKGKGLIKTTSSARVS